MKTLIILVLVFIFDFTLAYSQYDDDNCPGDSAICTNWDTTITNKRVQLSYLHDQYADVNYRFRYCNGVLEIDILSVTVLDNSGILREFNIQHYDFATLRSIIELGIITEHDEEYGIDSFPRLHKDSIYNCQDTVSWVNFYSASCGIFLKCEYRRTNLYRSCEQGYLPPYPEIYWESTPAVVTYKWQSCGNNCCKRTYKVCRDMSQSDLLTNGEDPIPILRIINTNIQSISWCSLQGNYLKTCYTNCWNLP